MATQKEHAVHTKFLPRSLALGLLALSCGSAYADDAADRALTGNVALTSDYIFRGLTQTWGGPAIQGGADLTFKEGLALGTWASLVSGKSFPNGNVELDVYGSYGRSFATDWSWRVGVYSYLYSGNLDQASPALPPRGFDTIELNAALGWKWITLKYSHSLTDYFAIDRQQGYRGDSRGTGYLQLDASIPLGDVFTLSLHAAHTNISTELASPLASGETDPSYSDYGATLKWQFHPNWNAQVGATYADNSDFYAHTVSFRNPADDKDVGGGRGFVMVQATF